MRKIITMTLLVSITSMANEKIKYETLADNKKYVIDTTNILRDYQISNLNNMMYNDLSDSKNTGEIYMDSLDSEKNIKSIGNRTNIIVDKENYYLTSSFNLGKKILFEGNQVDLGIDLGYLNSKLLKNNLNGVIAGINMKLNISEYKINLLAKQNFDYVNINYLKKFNQNYTGFSGSLKINTNIGEKFYIEPGLIAAYTYNLKDEVSDMNKDVIKLIPNLNASAGAYVRVGYKKGNLDLSVMYGLNKRIKNQNKYEIFDKELEIKSNDYISHNMDTRLNYLIKDKHNISLNVGMENLKFKGGLGYKYIW